MRHPDTIGYDLIAARGLRRVEFLEPADGKGEGVRFKPPRKGAETATHGQLRLRCVTQPDSAQAALLDRLGVVLPKRMRLAEQELPAIAASA